jgi:hypothetical protein
MTNKSLVDKLLKASQEIHQSSLRGYGNYIRFNSNIADIINKLERQKNRKSKINKLFRDEE